METNYYKYNSYVNAFKYLIPFIENKFNIKIVNVLGESVGVAYLTNINTIIKITPSISEIKVFKKQLKHYNKYFPKVYNISLLPNNKGWYIIHKEFIPELPKDVKVNYNELEAHINEWYDDFDEDVLMSIKIYETKDTLFEEFIKNEEPKLVWIYNNLIELLTSIWDIIDNNAIDLYDENLGYNGKNLILFDL